MIGKKENLMIEFTREQATLSKCMTGKVAAILVSSDMSQIYSIGINGGPKKGLQCLCNVNEIDRTKYTCVHAEQNCLVKNTSRDMKPKILICTKQPCAVCASLIVNVDINIQEVWYIENYWDCTGIDILRDARILPKQIVYVKKTWRF